MKDQMKEEWDGMQLFVLAICIFMLACIGAFYPYNRGALYTALIVLYAATAGISGYIAASLYRQMEGKSWVRNILLTCFIYCGPFFLMFCFANTVAIVYRVRPSFLIPSSFSSATSSSYVCHLDLAFLPDGH